MRRWVDGCDVLAAVGLGLLGAGVAMVSVPAALIVTGAVLMAMGIVGAYRKGSGR